MDGVHTTVDASAMLECRIPGGIMAEHLNAQPGPCLKVGTAGEHFDLNGNDFVRLDRLALPMGMPGTAWATAFGVELAMESPRAGCACLIARSTLSGVGQAVPGTATATASLSSQAKSFL